MGFLDLFSKKIRPSVQQLPSGSLTVDRDGHIVSTTVSSNYPPLLLRDVTHEVLRLFRDARKAEMPLTELHIHFASLRVTAREMRGGAIIFLTPKSSFTNSPST